MQIAVAQEKRVDVEGSTVVVVSAGWPVKRRFYERLAGLGARVVIVDEPGHWSEQLVQEGVASGWMAAPVTGDARTDAKSVLAALREAKTQPDGVLTFWEDSVPVAARVAAALGLPGNPVEAVDAARSKLRTRELFERLGLPSPRAIRVRSLDELYAAAADLGFPAVLKPEFGASAVGCVRVDTFLELPEVYRLVREVVTLENEPIFRAGSDLLLEQYLDGVEFDIDLVLEEGKSVFSSVSENWPTAERTFQETGLHCPPDQSARAIRELVGFCVEAVQAVGFRTGVLHIEAKTTRHGPRIVEINARIGGGRVPEMVAAVWDVDLVEAQLRAALGLPQMLRPSRRPRCAVVDQIVYAPASGRLTALPFAEVSGYGDLGLKLDIHADIGDEVAGPETGFASSLAEMAVAGRDLRHARSLAAEVLRDPPQVEVGIAAGAG